MTRVLAIHLNETLTLPPEENPARTIQRHIEYARDLDYYCIITKTLTSRPRHAQSPLDNMDVLPSNSPNRYAFLRDAYQMAGQIIEQHEIKVLTVQEWRWLGALGLLLRHKYRVALNLQLHNQVYGNPYYRRESLEAWLGDRLGRFVIPRADTWWVGTQAQKRRLIERGIPADCVFHTPFFIPTERFQEADGAHLRSSPNFGGASHLILWVGRMVKVKDLETLLRSFCHVLRAFPKAILVLVGDGPRRSDAQRLVEHLDIEGQVRFCGYVPYADVPRYYAAADVVCVSSLYEGTCRVILEGMAAGKPVVSTDVDGALDAIEDDVTGYVVPRRSPERLAKAVLQLLEDKGLARQMGLAGRERLTQHFTMDRHFSTFIKMWEATSIMTQQIRDAK